MQGHLSLLEIVTTSRLHKKLGALSVKKDWLRTFLRISQGFLLILCNNFIDKSKKKYCLDFEN
jgi:hypothetical protein